MFAKIKENFTKESANYLLWIPIFLGFGILIYFFLPTEPPKSIGLILTIVLGGGAVAFHHNFPIFKIILLLFFIAFGFCIAGLRTNSLDTVTLKVATNKLWVEGRVVQIQHLQSGKRLILDDLNLYKYRALALKKIRINVKSSTENLDIGDRIKVQAVLLPPPNPITPGGFDFAKYAYFKELGAIGYATSKVRIISKPSDSILALFSKLRNRIIEKVKSNLENPISGIANGVLVGDASSIAKEDYDILRVAGIAHLLAISGMHLVVVVAILFVSTRFLITRSEYLTLRIDSKKCAAIIAFIGSTFYLLLTLAPVSAQRAYIMSTIILFAIIFDHNASALRAIVIAALLILSATPEEILNPSLQMSFVASLALISSFNFLNKFLISKDAYALIKVFNYFISVIFSSLIAGLVTAPFIIYHFNQFSTYSVLTNLLAIPINDFWVMPFGIIALALMPFGLESLGLTPMSLGIELMFKISKLVSALPYSSFSIISFSNIGIFLISFSCIAFLICSTNLRLVFIIPFILGFFFQNPYSNPDILVASNGKVFAVRVGEDLIFSSKKGSRYIREIWQQVYRQKELKLLRDGALPKCDATSCLYEKNGKKVWIFSHSLSCNEANIIIDLSSQTLKCPASEKVINMHDLKTNGTLSVWLNNNDVSHVYSNISQLKTRPWQQ